MQKCRKLIECIAKKDLKDATRSLQVCAGQESGSEEAFHAIYEIYQDETEDEAI